MNFTILKATIQATIKDYHPHPLAWVEEHERIIRERATADGCGTFLKALELYLEQRNGKLRFFFEDYASYRHQAQGGSPGWLRRAPQEQMDRTIKEDLEHVAEIRAEGLAYFEGSEWQAFKRSLWVSTDIDEKHGGAKVSAKDEEPAGATRQNSAEERIEF